MRVTELMLSIDGIHKANVENYKNSLNEAALSMIKIKECEKQLNAHKKYKDMTITTEEYNKIIRSITNMTIGGDDE